MTGKQRYDWLVQRITKKRYTIGAEVGVNTGRTTSILLKMCPKLHLFAVDAWGPIPDDPSAPDYRQIGLEGRNASRARNTFHRVMRPYKNRMTVLEGLSVRMADKVEDGSLDFVFIDADHRYAPALADIKAWFPKVRSGGMVSGHDYAHERFPGVTQAVREYFGDNFIDTGVDYVWYTIKE